MNATKHDPARTYTRRFPDCHEFRNASITVEPLNEWQSEFFDEASHVVTMHHENWTGAEWIPITNSDHGDFDFCVRTAREMRRYFTGS